MENPHMPTTERDAESGQRKSEFKTACCRVAHPSSCITTNSRRAAIVQGFIDAEAEKSRKAKTAKE